MFISTLLVAAILTQGRATPAQSPRPAQPGTTARPGLAGPIVPDSRSSSLVQRDFNGQLVKLELFPAHAALRFLELDGDSRAKVERILTERAAILDTAVRDHFDLLIELFSAGQAGDQPETIRIAIAFTQKIKPLIARGALESELAKVIPQSQAQRLAGLVREYYDALIAEAGTNEKGKPKTRFEVVAGETLRLWSEQIRLSFERQIVGGDLFFERIIRQLKLRPEQEDRVRDKIAAYVEETKLNPTKEQEQRFALEIMAWLDPAQQKNLIRIFKQAEGQYKPKARPEDKPENEVDAPKAPPADAPAADPMKPPQ
jgi:hypothetical protein